MSNKIVTIKEDREFGIEVDTDFEGSYYFEYKDNAMDARSELKPHARRDAYRGVAKELDKLIKAAKEAQKLCRDRARRAK